jgi:hypothetical protein
MPGKLDEISAAIGELRSSVVTLFRRADEDRRKTDQDRLRVEEDRRKQEQRHNDNQRAMAQMRETSATAHAELRKALEDLTREIRASPPPQIGAMSRGRMMALATVGLVTLWIIGRVLESAFSWLIAHFLNMKFGSGG